MGDLQNIPKWIVVIALGAILVTALALRLWGISFGLPYLYHFDEHFYVNTALKTGTGVLHYPPNTPPGLSNLLLFHFGAYYVLGRLAGVFANASEFEAAFRSDPTVFYMLGRVTSAILSTASVFLAFLLASKIANRLTGLLASALLAVAFIDVRNAHYLIPDIALSFLIFLTVTLACLGVQSRNLAYVYGAALTAGVAVSMKWTGLAVIIPVGLAGILVVHSRWRSGARLVKTIIIIVSLFLLGFAVAAPQVFIAPELYLAEIANQRRSGSTGGFELWQVDTVPGWIFYLKILQIGLGLPFLVLAVIGFGLRVAKVIRKKDRVSLVFIAFPTIYFAIMGATLHYFARYALPFIPFAAFFAADAIVTAATTLLPKRQWLVAGVSTTVLVAAVATPFVNSVLHNRLLTETDTRTIAREWIEQNIPEAAKIAVEWRTHSPPLASPERSVPYSTRDFTVQIFEQVGLSQHSVDWYRDQGFEYIVTSSFISENPLVYPDMERTRREFYPTVAKEYTLLNTFSPTIGNTSPSFIFDEMYGPLISLWERVRPGPIVKIYKVD